MRRHLVSYFATLIAFLAIDLIWLGVIARGFYRDAFAAAGFNVEINLAIAFLFYAIYVVGLVIFAVAPALDRGSWSRAALFGGLFGFFAYATYDMTNLATLRDWPLTVSLVDIPWGVFLSASASALGYRATQALAPDA